MTPDRIHEIRTRAGLSVNQLADMLNLGPNGADRVREFERGKRDASGPIVRLLELIDSGSFPIF
jgi:DNA-binding transcriptional regulator YiaG